MKTNLCFSAGIIMLIFSQSSCIKDDHAEPNQHLSKHSETEAFAQKSKYSKNYGVQIGDLYNSANPFDRYGEELEVLYDSLYLAFQDEDLELSEVNTIVENLISTHEADLYPIIDETSYTLAEASILSSFFGNSSPANIVQSSQSIESTISNSTTLSSLQKNRLFSLVSQYKYHLVYMQYFYDDLNKRSFDRCMKDKLGEIFNDDNPVDDIAFIVGTPASFFWTAGYCLYDSWFL